MGSGLFSNDPNRNKNLLFLRTLTILIIMIAIVIYAIHRLTQSGKTQDEQQVAFGNKWF
jgi:hypothetical protein